MSYARGLSFPLQMSSDGSFRVDSGADKIKSNLKHIISTDLKERLMSPSFGCSVKDRLFKNMDESMASFIRMQVKTGIETSDSRVSVIDVRVNSGGLDGILSISIQFRIDGFDDLQDVTLFIKD